MLTQNLLDDGSLFDMLEAFAITYPGYRVYCAARRASPALTVVVEALRLQLTYLAPISAR
jgi:hypothetical protein